MQPSTRPRVLIVDDDERNRDLMQAMCESLGHQTLTAADGVQALALAQRHEWDLVLLDVMMPGMDGFEVARNLRSQPRTRDLPIIMVTALNSQQDRLKAVEAGGNDFISKPVDRTELKVRSQSLLEMKQAQDQVKAQKAELEVLLQKTLVGVVQLLVEQLSLLAPQAHGRASRVASLSGRLARAMKLADRWDLSVAAMLSQLGLLALPKVDLERMDQGGELSAQGQTMLQDYAAAGADLVGRIPRLEKVAQIIRHQDSPLGGADDPEQIPLAARLLKVALDCDRLQQQGLGASQVLERLRSEAQHYDPQALAALERVLSADTDYRLQAVAVLALEPGMILAEEVYAVKPYRPLLAKGQELSASMVGYLKRYSLGAAVNDPIRCFVPHPAATQTEDFSPLAMAQEG